MLLNEKEQLWELIIKEGNCYNATVDCCVGGCPFYKDKNDGDLDACIFNDRVSIVVSRKALVYANALEMYARKYNKEDIVELLL